MSVAMRHGEHARNVARAQCSRNLTCCILLTLMVVVALAACRRNGPTLFDQTIPPNRWIQLMDGGPHTGKANAGSAVLAYSYERLPSSKPDVSLSIEGQILSVIGDVEQVNIYVLGLDGQGKAISRTVVFASGYKRSVYFRQSWGFQKYVTLPPETAAMAFHTYTKRSRGRK